MTEVSRLWYSGCWLQENWIQKLLLFINLQKKLRFIHIINICSPKYAMVRKIIKKCFNFSISKIELVKNKFIILNIVLFFE